MRKQLAFSLAIFGTILVGSAQAGFMNYEEGGASACTDSSCAQTCTGTQCGGQAAQTTPSAPSTPAASAAPVAPPVPIVPSGAAAAIIN